MHIYCWIEIAQSDPTQVRQLSRGIWALIVFIPFAGAGRLAGLRPPQRRRVVQAAPKPRPRVVAPDDDPDFLRSLRPPKPPPDDGPSH